MVAVLLAGAGCATSAGGVEGDLARAAEAAASASASGALAVRLLEAGRSTASATDTALADALRESQAAEVAAATLTVATATEAAERERVLRLVRRATTALVDARTRAGGVDAARPAPSARLARLADALERLGSELGGGG